MKSYKLIAYLDKYPVVILIILILVSCTPRLIPVPEPTQGAIPTMTPNPTTPNTPNLQSLIEKAKADLAQRLSISVDQINGIEAQAVIWSNSSLGCPQPGMMYTEVLTPGYLILLNANGQDYEYHAGKGSDIFLCENPLPPVEGQPGNT